MPTTPATLLAWAETWLRLSVDEELLSGPLTDDRLARDRYGRSARQLRRLRQAVLSGALRHGPNSSVSRCRPGSSMSPRPATGTTRR